MQCYLLRSIGVLVLQRSKLVRGHDALRKGQRCGCSSSVARYSIRLVLLAGLNQQIGDDWFFPLFSLFPKTLHDGVQNPASERADGLGDWFSRLGAWNLFPFWSLLAALVRVRDGIV